MCAIGVVLVGAINKHYRNRDVELFSETQTKMMHECKGLLNVTLVMTNDKSQSLAVSCEVDKGE